jgi:2-polyprenyl-3-methyl-5-hydroxy-6-metoxy-1,4-benzoquinol methylase
VIYDEYDDDFLAAIYDGDNPDGRDHDYYRGLATSLTAIHITDLGCGTGILTVTLATQGRTVGWYRSCSRDAGACLLSTSRGLG